MRAGPQASERYSRLPARLVRLRPPPASVRPRRLPRAHPSRAFGSGTRWQRGRVGPRRLRRGRSHPGPRAEGARRRRAGRRRRCGARDGDPRGAPHCSQRPSRLADGGRRQDWPPGGVCVTAPGLPRTFGAAPRRGSSSGLRRPARPKPVLSEGCTLPPRPLPESCPEPSGSPGPTAPPCARLQAPVLLGTWLLPPLPGLGRPPSCAASSRPQGPVFAVPLRALLSGPVAILLSGEPVSRP
nr:wiskott-Aldrich syndrome protein homolog 1-like [Manis javanica]